MKIQITFIHLYPIQLVFRSILHIIKELESRIDPFLLF